jgi:hypothetical protein
MSVQGTSNVASTTLVDDPGSSSKAHPTEGSKAACPFFNAAARGDVNKLREVAAETMRDHVFGDDTYVKAEKVLVTALQHDPADLAGKTNHLLGLCFFHQLRWGDAIRHLEVALERNPGNADTQALLDKAKVSLTTNPGFTGAQNPMPTKEQLLAPAGTGWLAPDHLEPIPAGKEPGKIKRALQAGAAKLGGAVIEAYVGVAEGTRSKSTTFAHQSWWGSDKLPQWLRNTLAVGRLGAAREFLNAHALHDGRDPILNQGAGGGSLPYGAGQIRSADGSYTVLTPGKEKVGAAGTRYGRSGAAPELHVNRMLDTTLPSAREVARAFLHPKGERKYAATLNGLMMPWLQPTLIHDLGQHATTTTTGKSYQIELAEDDPLRKRYGMKHLSVPQTVEGPLESDSGKANRSTETFWWDGSSFYGSSPAVQNLVRTGADGQILKDGKLRIDGELLPIDPRTGVEQTGFSKNMWLGMGIFHALIPLIHNDICDTVLKPAHPTWTSDQLFHVARLNTCATIVKIHTIEWTTALLANQALVTSMGANFWGALQTINNAFEEREITSAWEIMHEVLGGVVGGATNDHGVDFAMSEEFTDVYRGLHAALPDHLDIIPTGATEPVERVTLEEMRGAGSRNLIEKHGLATIFHSFAMAKMPLQVPNNYPEATTNLSVDGQSVVDLATNDIVRSRERVPPYNVCRRYLGLPELKSFADFGCDQETTATLERMYGKDGIDKIELAVGYQMEVNRFENAGISETQFMVFVQQATRRIQADPFYTERFDAQHYSKEGLDYIHKANLKGILFKLLPALQETNLKNLNNVFEPASSTVATHPKEHPLSAGAERYLNQDPTKKKG